MDQLLEQIADIGENEIGDLLTAVLKRYGELFPEWEICTLSLYKDEERDEQIDRIIEMLEKMKSLQ